MATLQAIFDTLPEARDIRIPPGDYRLDGPVRLPKVRGVCRVRGYGARIIGGAFTSIVRPDEGERDSCTGWTIEGLEFLGGQCATDIHQTRQLTLDRCSVSGAEVGHNLSFCLLARVENCVLSTSKLGVRIGHGLSTTGALSNCSSVAHTRFFGQGDQLRIDSCSGVVVDQCTFEGRGADRCLIWNGCHSMVTRNLAIRNCYWEVAGGPATAAIYLHNLESPSVAIDQPEAHPGGAGNRWTWLKCEHNVNALVEIRNPTVLHGQFDCPRSGVRHLLISSPQYSLWEGAGDPGLGLARPSRWHDGVVRATFTR